MAFTLIQLYSLFRRCWCSSPTAMRRSKFNRSYEICSSDTGMAHLKIKIICPQRREALMQLNFVFPIKFKWSSVSFIVVSVST